MPQNHPFGRGLPPSPTAQSPDQHPAAMLANVSQYIYWAGLKAVVWGLVSLSALTQGSVWNASPLQMGTQTTVPCAQAEDRSLLGPLQSPNWVKVCLVSTVFFLPVSVVPRVQKCLSLSVQGCVSAEPDCQFLQVCLLFRFQYNLNKNNSKTAYY